MWQVEEIDSRPQRGDSLGVGERHKQKEPRDVSYVRWDKRKEKATGRATAVGLGSQQDGQEACP